MALGFGLIRYGIDLSNEILNIDFDQGGAKISTVAEKTVSTPST